MKWKILIVIMAVFIIGALLIQLIPLPGRGNNPPVTQNINWDTPETEVLVRDACYDCHSNEIVWPWYSYVAPVSWLIYYDVMEGRDKMNFSEGRFPDDGIEEIIEVIQEGEMPPPLYLITHPSARLTEAEKQQLINGMMNSLPNISGPKNNRGD